MSKYFIEDNQISKFDDITNDKYVFSLPNVCSLLNRDVEEYEKLAEKFLVVSKALGLACEDIQFYEDLTPVEMKVNDYIRQAKEYYKKLKEQNYD